MGKNRRREKNRALYISKLMYRGSIPPISNLLEALCTSIYSKITRKSLMSAEYKVTKGIYTRKYQAKNIWEVGGACVEKQRKIRTTHGLCEFWRCCVSFAQASNNLNVLCECCASFAQAWSNCLPKAISSLFQLQIVHGLKSWILDFLSFEMVYSM